MKLKTPLVLVALVALSVLWIPAVTASTPVAQPLEDPALLLLAAPAPVCSAGLTFGEAPIFQLPTRAAGCGTSQCTSSCRAQGYDYGVCLGSQCICRFYYP